jgi:hypothetical protein
MSKQQFEEINARNNLRERPLKEMLKKDVEMRLSKSKFGINKKIFQRSNKFQIIF